MLDERWIRALHVETTRQSPPYRLLAEVVLEQHVFELTDVEGRCSASAGLRARLDPSSELHVELPPAVDLADPDLAASTHAAVDAVECAR